MEWVNLMYSRASFPGNIRLETTICLKPNGSGIGILLGIPEPGERSGFLDGYFIWMGSNTSSKLFRSSVEVMSMTGAKLLPNRAHTICIEKLDDHLRIYLDGKLECHYISHKPLVGTHVGLLSKDADFKMEPIKVFLASQSVQVNCLAVPDAFLGNHLYGKAISEYRRIGYSFPGRAEGREALFRAGVTLLEEASSSEKKKRKQQLFSLALIEFTKLRTTAGAPLEYLGKSLVYKAMGDFEEEIKCLELAVRKYPKHPLLSILIEEIGFRLQQCSAKNRKAGLLFTLLALRHLPKLFASDENLGLLESLQHSLERLPFLENVGEIDSFANLSVQLSFWLNKPITLLEIFEQTQNENTLFALLHLGRFDMCKDLSLTRPFEVALLAEKKPKSALFTALQEFPENEKLLSLILLCLIDKEETSDLPDLPIKELKARILLHEKKWEEVRKLFDDDLIFSLHSPYFVLYGCYLRAVEGEEAALAHFAIVEDVAHPPLASLLACFLQKKISMEDLLYWEKISLLRDLVLYYESARSPKAKMWRKALRKEKAKG